MKRLILLCVLFASFSCALPPELETLHPVGSKYSGEIKLGEKVLPLPEGVWELAACGTLNQFFRMALIKRESYGSYNMLYIIVDKPFLERMRGYVNNSELQKNTIYHKVVKNNTAGQAQDAWSIELISKNYWKTGKNPFLLQISKYLEKNDLSMSSIFVRISHRLTSWNSKKDYIVYRHSIDPATRNMGIDSWDNWLPENIKYNDIISGFINQLKIYGEDQHGKIKKGLGIPL